MESVSNEPINARALPLSVLKTLERTVLYQGQIANTIAAPLPQTVKIVGSKVIEAMIINAVCVD